MGSAASWGRVRAPGPTLLSPNRSTRLVMHNRNRNVGIVGVGQTAYSGHREEVNQPDLINEAVQAALQDAGLRMEDVECVVHGNMELFEMVHQPDIWHVLGDGGYGKDFYPNPVQRGRHSSARCSG